MTSTKKIMMDVLQNAKLKKAGHVLLTNALKFVEI